MAARSLRLHPHHTGEEKLDGVLLGGVLRGRSFHQGREPSGGGSEDGGQGEGSCLLLPPELRARSCHCCPSRQSTALFSTFLRSFARPFVTGMTSHFFSII